MNELERGPVLHHEEFPTLSREHAVWCIEHDRFVCHPELFARSVALSRHPQMLNRYTVEEYTQMQTFLLPGYHIGFALKLNQDRHYEIVSVHNNENEVRDVGSSLIRAAIRHGGTHLDHFGSQKLCDLYGQFGFVEVRREPYNPIFDPDGSFRARYGELPVIYRELKRGSP